MALLINKFFNLFYRTSLSGNKGKLAYQPLFEQMYKMGLEGMNYNNSNIATNGEMYNLHQLAKRLDVQSEVVIFDVGANKGDYSKILLDAFKNKNLKLYSFEPSAEIYQQFTENVQDPRVEVFNFGMGEKSEVMRLYKTDKSSGLSSLYQRNLAHFNIEMDKYEEISIHTLDEFCMEKGIEAIDFLKMDVEGHESKVLSGAKNMLNSDKIKYIQFEFGGCNIDSRTYFQDFYYALKEKYHIYRIMKDGLYPMTQYKEIYEIFTTINFFAKLKSLP